MENTSKTTNFENNQVSPSWEATSEMPDYSEIDFTDTGSERMFEDENNKRLQEISDTVVEMEGSNEAGVEFYVLGSGAMMHSMMEAGFSAKEISHIMRERRKISNHGMDLDVAVSSEEDLNIMRSQLDFAGDKDQDAFGKHGEVVDLMVRSKLPGFEPEEITINGNRMLVQSTDEMIFEKTNALVADTDIKELKWAQDRHTLKEILERRYGTSKERVDSYLADRYEEYSTRKLEVALDGLMAQLGDDLSKNVDDLIPEGKILAYLPNIDSVTLAELKSANESNILEVLTRLDSTMLPQWSEVDAKADAIFS